MGFDLEYEFKKVQYYGEQLLGANFKIEPKEIYTDMIKWFCGQVGELDLEKGICLIGSVGTGKTTIFRVLQASYRKEKPFRIASARHISRDAMASDKPILIVDFYGRHSYAKTQHGHVDHLKPIDTLFDDLGAENESIKFYGNEIKIMGDIIQDRYIEFIERGMLTHATMNLNGDAFEAFYGKRCYDRWKEMCNIITLDGESKRK